MPVYYPSILGTSSGPARARSPRTRLDDGRIQTAYRKEDAFSGNSQSPLGNCSHKHYPRTRTDTVPSHPHPCDEHPLHPLRKSPPVSCSNPTCLSGRRTHEICESHLPPVLLDSLETSLKSDRHIRLCPPQSGDYGNPKEEAETNLQLCPIRCG